MLFVTITATITFTSYNGGRTGARRTTTYRSTTRIRAMIRRMIRAISAITTRMMRMISAITTRTIITRWLTRFLRWVSCYLFGAERCLELILRETPASFFVRVYRVAGCFTGALYFTGSGSWFYNLGAGLLGLYCRLQFLLERGYMV